MLYNPVRLQAGAAGIAHRGLPQLLLQIPCQRMVPELCIVALTISCCHPPLQRPRKSWGTDAGLSMAGVPYPYGYTAICWETSFWQLPGLSLAPLTTAKLGQQSPLSPWYLQKPPSVVLHLDRH